MMAKLKQFSFLAVGVLFVMTLSGCGGVGVEKQNQNQFQDQSQKQTSNKQESQKNEKGNGAKNNQGAGGATNEDALLSEEEVGAEAELSNQEIDDLVNAYDENEL